MKFKIVLFLSGLILISGCVDKETVISPGVYKISIKATKLEKKLMPIQIFREFKADGSYKCIWKANVFGLMEEKGDWEVEGGFIRFPNSSVRQIDESGALGAWETDPKYNIIKYKIRNIMENSFEIYIEPSDNEDRKIFEKLGLEEGWYTYQKIR
jgi:hypothetical protein